MILVNESCRIQKLRENLELKNKLNKLGICGIIGPTGQEEFLEQI